MHFPPGLRLILVVCFVLTPYSLIRGGQVDSLQERVRQASTRNDYRTLSCLAPEYVREATAEGDTSQLAAAYYYWGVADLVYDINPESAEPKFQKALALSSKNNDCQLKVLSLNSLGLLEGWYRGHVSLGQDYLMRAMEENRKCRLMRIEAALYGNISGFAYLQGDSIGSSFARLSYDSARRSGDLHALVAACYILASWAIEDGNLSLARKLINEAEKICSDNNFSGRAKFDLLRARVAMAERDPSAAVKILSKVLVSHADGDRMTEMDALRIMTQAFATVGDHRQSEIYGRRAIALGDSVGLHLYDRLLYRLLADNAYDSGDYQQACQWLNFLTDAIEDESRSRQESVRRERRMSLQIARQEQNAAVSLAKLHGQRTALAILCVAVLLLGIALYVIVRRNIKVNLLYTKLVGSYKLSMQREQAMMETKSGSRKVGMAQGKSNDIYASLCRLMEEERLWADPGITRESLAERLGTNRTYLSATLRENARMSLPQFINSYRVREALKLLSDPDYHQIPMRQMALELGFSSESRFFSFFRQETGMSPSQYRKSTLNKTKLPL